MTQFTGHGRLLQALREAARERWREERARESIPVAERPRLARRRRDCRSLARLGRPAREAVALATQLGAQWGPEARPGTQEVERLALELTAVLVELYDEILADLPD